MYLNATEPIEIHKDWWWPDDVRKLSIASGAWIKQKVAEEAESRAKKLRRG
jgi:hypothetical protein